MIEPWGGFIEMDYRLPSQVHTVLTNALAIVGWTRLRLPEAPVQIRLQCQNCIFYILKCSAKDWLPSQDGDLFSVLNIIYQDSKILEFPCLKLFFQWAWQKKLSWFNNIKLHMIILCFPLYITLSMWINAKKTWLLNITMDYIDVCLCLPSSVWFLK